MKAQRPEFVHNGKPDVDLVLTTSLFQLHGMEFLHYGFGFFTSGFLAPLSMDGLEHLGYHLHFRTRWHGKTLR